jgi:hypothetical protein
MTAWECATWITVAGAVGGFINTLMGQEKLRLPVFESGLLCPGFIGNVVVGAFAALISWALYGAGAGIDLARQTANTREVLSLTVGALAGAALVGVGGARWLSSEVDTKLLRASVNVSTERMMSAEQRGMIASAPAIDVLRTVREASSSAS